LISPAFASVVDLFLPVSDFAVAVRSSDSCCPFSSASVSPVVT
jgi:hypothetical protein